MKQIRNKLLVYILLPTAALFTLSLLLIGKLSTDALVDYALDDGNTRIESGSLYISQRLELSLKLLEKTIDTIEILHRESNKNRTLLPELFGNYLQSYPEIFSLWVYFQPDSWDSKDAEYANTEDYDETGNYAVWAYREAGSSEVTVSTEAWGMEEYDEDYYAVPFKTSELYISEPYEEEIREGYNVQMISLSQSVQNSDGRNIAVAGIDISLDFLMELIAWSDNYSHGSSTIAFDDGIIIADSNIEHISGHLDDFFNQITLQAISSLNDSEKTLRLTVESENDSKNDIQLIKSFEIHEGLPHWLYIMSIPESIIMEIPNTILRWIIILEAITLSMLLFILIMISVRLSSL